MKITTELLVAYRLTERKQKNKKFREELFIKDPHCYWCKAEVKNYPDIQNRQLKRGEMYPDDLATLDHLYDKFDFENRYKVYKNNENKVLACYKCNSKRGQDRVDKLPKDYMLKRSELASKRQKGTPRIFLFNKLPSIPDLGEKTENK